MLLPHGVDEVNRGLEPSAPVGVTLPLIAGVDRE